MRKVLVIGSIIVGLALLAAVFASPVFARGPYGFGSAPPNQGPWEAMHEACQTGDWDAMLQAMQQAYGDSSGYPYCHGGGPSAPNEGTQLPANRWGGMGGHMGWGGMMGW